MGPRTKVVPGDGDLVARCGHGGATPGGQRRDAGWQVVYRSTGGTGGQLVGDTDGNGQVGAYACRGKKVWAAGGALGVSRLRWRNHKKADELPAQTAQLRNAITYLAQRSPASSSG
jgi:hypothetical protein